LLQLLLCEGAGKLLISELTEGSPAAQSKKIKVGDEIVAVVSGGIEQSMLGRSVEHLVKALAGPAGTVITLRIVPKGTIKPVDVELRRAAAVKQGNRTVFRELRGGTSAHACTVLVDGNLVVLDANNGNVLSAIRTVDIGPSGLSEASPDGRLLAVLSKRTGGGGLGLEVFDVRTQSRTQFVDRVLPRSLGSSCNCLQYSMPRLSPGCTEKARNLRRKLFGTVIEHEAARTATHEHTPNDGQRLAA
jgi:hypothetical protein